MLARSDRGGAGGRGDEEQRCVESFSSCLSGITEFGPVARGRTRTITMRFWSSISFILDSVWIVAPYGHTEDFVVNPGSCITDTPIGKDVGCTLSVTFGPTAEGTRKAGLVFQAKTQDWPRPILKPWGLRGGA